VKKEMLRFRKNGKAPNLFNLSVLFIVFMVVVSIGVNVLVATQTSHALPIEDLTVSNVTFSDGDTVNVFINNSGTLDLAVAEVWVNSQKQAFTTNPTMGEVPPHGSMEISVNHTYANGTNYHIKIVSDRNNDYFASATALPPKTFENIP
jgi:hypothetical protein